MYQFKSFITKNKNSFVKKNLLFFVTNFVFGNLSNLSFC